MKSETKLTSLLNKVFNIIFRAKSTPLWFSKNIFWANVKVKAGLDSPVMSPPKSSNLVKRIIFSPGYPFFIMWMFRRLQWQFSQLFSSQKLKDVRQWQSPGYPFSKCECPNDGDSYDCSQEIKDVHQCTSWLSIFIMWMSRWLRWWSLRFLSLKNSLINQLLLPYFWWVLRAQRF